MAITLTSQPPELSQAYRPIEWVVESDDLNIAKMKGVFSIDGVAMNSNAPIILDPDIGFTDTFTFDVQALVQDSLKSYRSTNEVGSGLPAIDSATLFEPAESFGELTATFTELISSGGLLIDGAGLSPVVNPMVINYYLTHLEDQTESNYNLSSSAKKFLTDAPTTKWTPNNGHETITAVLQGGAYSTVRLQVVTTDTVGATATYLMNAINLQSNGMADIPIGVNNLNAYTLVSGSQPVIDSTIVSYVINILGDGSPISESRTFKIDRKCTDNDVRFVWEGRKGLEYYTFKGEFERRIQVEKETYTRQLSSDFSIDERGITTIGTKSVEVFRVFSGIINDATRIFLETLYEDSLTWIISGTDYVPVNIITTEVTTVNEEKALFQVEIEYSYSNQNIGKKN